MNKGVSIVICCYNSSALLPDTLSYIFKLKVPPEIPFEILIVDNNSTDNTSEVAKDLFLKSGSKVTYRILFQKEQGLSSARKMGFENSKYEFVIYCDDDNWLGEDYVSLSYKLMCENEKIGALGGESEAVTDAVFPFWFDEFRQNYSAGSQFEKSGVIDVQNGALWGAGMVLRKSALNELYSKGFKSLLTDRKKDMLTSGGDIELCYALRLAGWNIWYEPALKIRHYIPKRRLSWDYLRKLNRGFGAQKVNLAPYLKAFNASENNHHKNSEEKWHLQTLSMLKKLRSHGIGKLLKYKNSSEGNAEILKIEKTIGRINELIKIRSEYEKRIQYVKNAPWRKVVKESKL